MKAGLWYCRFSQHCTVVGMRDVICSEMVTAYPCVPWKWAWTNVSRALTQPCTLSVDVKWIKQFVKLLVDFICWFFTTNIPPLVMSNQNYHDLPVSESIRVWSILATFPLHIFVLHPTAPIPHEICTIPVVPVQHDLVESAILCSLRGILRCNIKMIQCQKWYYNENPV